MAEGVCGLPGNAADVLPDLHTSGFVPELSICKLIHFLKYPGILLYEKTQSARITLGISIQHFLHVHLVLDHTLRYRNCEQERMADT